MGKEEEFLFYSKVGPNPSIFIVKCFLVLLIVFKELVSYFLGPKRGLLNSILFSKKHKE